MAKQHLRTGLRTGVLLLVAISLAWIAGSHFMQALPAVTTFSMRLLAILFLLLTSIILTILAYVLFVNRRFSLRSLLFVMPIIAATITIPTTPFFRNQLLQNQLQRAGISNFKLEPNGFEVQLTALTERLVDRRIHLFNTKLTTLQIDIVNCQPQQLQGIVATSDLLRVIVENHTHVHHFPSELIEWINKLPSHTKIFIITAGLNDFDVAVLQGLTHRITKYQIAAPVSANALDFLISAETEYLQLNDVPFPMDFQPPKTFGVAQRLVIQGDCMDGKQILDFAEWKKAASLWWTESTNKLFSPDDCSRLAIIPHLRELDLKTPGLNFDCLVRIARSKELKSVHVADPVLSPAEILEIRAIVESNNGKFSWRPPIRPPTRPPVNRKSGAALWFQFNN